MYGTVCAVCALYEVRVACALYVLTEYCGQGDVLGVVGSTEGNHVEVARQPFPEGRREAQVEQLAAIGAIRGFGRRRVTPDLVLMM